MAITTGGLAGRPAQVRRLLIVLLGERTASAERNSVGILYLADRRRRCHSRWLLRRRLGLFRWHRRLLLWLHPEAELIGRCWRWRRRNWRNFHPWWRRWRPALSAGLRKRCSRWNDNSRWNGPGASLPGTGINHGHPKNI